MILSRRRYHEGTRIAQDKRKKEFVALVPQVLEEHPDCEVSLIAERVALALGMKMKRRSNGDVQVWYERNGFYIIWPNEPMDIWPPLGLCNTY